VLGDVREPLPRRRARRSCLRLAGDHCDIGSGHDSASSRGHDEGSGVASLEGLCGSHGHKCHQSLLIAATLRATALPGHWRRRCQAPGSILTSERVTMLVPARPITGLGPGSAGCPERRHQDRMGRSGDGDSAR
jgi:hypothetical protein